MRRQLLADRHALDQIIRTDDLMRWALKTLVPRREEPSR
jgi:hypothetical protein